MQLTHYCYPMKSRITFFCISLVFFTNSFAQTSLFEKGFVVTLKSDTLRGFIERKDEIALSNSIRFKNDVNSDSSQKYYPSDLLSFEFEKDKLHFEPVKYSYKLDSMSYEFFRFGKTLLKGYVTLYKMQLPSDEKRIIFNLTNTYIYILQKDSIQYKLEQQEKMIGSLLQVQKTYQGRLTYLFQDCQKISGQISNLPFKDNPMIKICEDYSRCIQPQKEVVLYSYVVKPIINYGFEASYVKIFNNSAISDQFGLAFGFFWNRTEPDISQSVAYGLGVDYMILKYNQGPIEVNEQYLRAPLLIQFPFRNGQVFNPYVNGGLNLQLPLEGFSLTTAFNFGIGAYVKRFKFDLLMESSNFSAHSEKLLNFKVGYCLNKRVK